MLMRMRMMIILAIKEGFNECYYVPSTLSAILQMRTLRAGKGSYLSEVTQLAGGRDGTQTESVWL